MKPPQTFLIVIVLAVIVLVATLAALGKDKFEVDPAQTNGNASTSGQTAR